MSLMCFIELTVSHICTSVSKDVVNNTRMKYGPRSQDVDLFCLGGNQETTNVITSLLAVICIWKCYKYIKITYKDVPMIVYFYILRLTWTPDLYFISTEGISCRFISTSPHLSSIRFYTKPHWVTRHQLITI